ncbi:MAG: hypothetical protein IJ653_04165 [Bacteroidales bacterium]|nr:hypothetical protein [Bacteroidales bacterium]
MRNEHQPGRRRNTCLSDLVQRRRILRGAGSFLFFCYLLSPPALLGSCRKLPPAGGTEPPEPGAPAAVDSVTMELRLETAGETVRKLDLFCYGSSGTQALELHTRLDSIPQTVRLRVPEGEKTVVGIANSPYAFNLAALGRLDAMKQLRYSFADDNPQAPILGGQSSLPAAGGTVRLRPLLCRVVLASVANTMDGYELLESPRVRLVDIPDTAEILREEEFRPSEMIDAGTWQDLPHDIGYFPAAPRTTLWCYPNDTPENVLGAPRPSLEFECSIRGETCSFSVPMPPLPRGSTREVELVIDGPDDFRYKVR